MTPEVILVGDMQGFKDSVSIFNTVEPEGAWYSENVNPYMGYDVQ